MKKDTKYFILETKKVVLFKNKEWEDHETIVNVAYEGIKAYDTFEEAEKEAKKCVDYDNELGCNRQMPQIVAIAKSKDGYYYLPAFSVIDGKVLEIGLEF